MPHTEFESWAVIALGGIPNKTRVGDKGIDGRIYPISTVTRTGERTFDLYPILAKQWDTAGNRSPATHQG